MFVVVVVVVVVIFVVVEVVGVGFIGVVAGGVVEIVGDLTGMVEGVLEVECVSAVAVVLLALLPWFFFQCLRAAACLCLFVRGIGFFFRLFCCLRPSRGNAPGLKKASCVSRRWYFESMVGLVVLEAEVGSMLYVAVVVCVCDSCFEFTLLLVRLAWDVRALWALGMLLLNGMAPRWPSHPALSAACLRRSSRSLNGGASRKRLPAEPISSCTARATWISLCAGDRKICPNQR